MHGRKKGASKCSISRVFGHTLSQRFRNHRARARARTCLGDAATNDARRASGGYIARACLAPESREGGLQRTSRYAEKHARAFFSRVCAACASRDTHTRNANKPVSRARVCFLHRATYRSLGSVAHARATRQCAIARGRLASRGCGRASRS